VDQQPGDTIESSKEKDEMRAIILSLTAQVAELRTKVDFLQNNKYEN